MRSEEFWDLSWGEWVGWIGKIHFDHRKAEMERDHSLMIARHWFSLYASAKSGKNYGPEDFLQPDRSDKNKEDTPKESPEEFFERMSKTRFVKRKKEVV
jgi:hypothetical protein